MLGDNGNRRLSQASPPSARTGGSNPSLPNSHDCLVLRSDAKTIYTPAETYVFADYWTAYDTLGAVVTAWKAKWNFGDRTTPIPTSGDGKTCTITPPGAYSGYVYIFVPSVRSEWKRLGQHFITVHGPDIPDSEVTLPPCAQ